MHPYAYVDYYVCKRQISSMYMYMLITRYVRNYKLMLGSTSIFAVRPVFGIQYSTTSSYFTIHFDIQLHKQHLKKQVQLHIFLFACSNVIQHEITAGQLESCPR